LVNLNYSLTGSNGDTIVFDYQNYVLNPEFTGFGIPPTQVRIEESAGTGGVWRNTKRGVRDVDLPITVVGSGRDEVQTKLRRLTRLLNDASGPTKINANYDSGLTLFLQAHYVGGAEGQWGESGGLTWAKWVLSFQAPNPHWISQAEESFTIGSGGTGRGLLPQLSRLRVSSSQTLGIVSVNNVGDVQAFPIWTITGPVDELVITNGTIEFSFNRAIFPGETLIVNTELGTVVDNLGQNQYSLLNPAPKLFPLQPGITNLAIQGKDSSPDTSIVCRYSPRFEVVH
jgi:phage-related protein